MALTGGKKIKGRKRHIAVDTMGNLLSVKVHAANIHDTMEGGNVCYQAYRKYCYLMGFSGDLGYRGTTYEYVKNGLKLKFNFPESNNGIFMLQKQRWMVERTFAWFGNKRRLAKDFEVCVGTSENMIRIAMIAVALGKLF